MRKDFLIFGSPQIEEDEIREVTASLRSGWLGTGPKVARFETDFAGHKRIDKTQVAAVNSCTAALHLSLIAAGIDPGDEVIVPAMTFCSTVNAIIHSGGVPILADVDPLTMNIDPMEIEKRVTSKTRAVIPVHFAGRCCDMDTIMDIAERHNLKIIEDCAHAVESEYKERKAGTIGDFGCFSFYVTKNMTTGEGGMVLAKNKSDITRVKSLALHGMSHNAWHRYSDEGYKHYKVVDCGYKYNMTDLQAAIGIHQLKRLEANWLRRQEIWKLYQEEYAELPMSRPLEPEPDTKHALHIYTILIDRNKTGMDRDLFLDRMTERKIGVGVHYLSIPEHPYYKKTFGWKPEDYPNAMRIGRQTVSLPLSAKLSDKDVQDVINAVKDTLKSS